MLSNPPSDQPPETPDFELRWECPNCGQHVFGAEPPDLCDFCQDFTTWRCIKPEQE
ncbi:MAG: hypothetical protein K8L97_33635 [Anaerolineae bacterium]|nr:hypothetical protein [Anaerolineae bacterium]